MKFLKKTILNIMRWAAKNDSNLGDEPDRPVNYSAKRSIVGPSIEDTKSRLNISIYSANGGKVIQTHTYDTTTDRSNTSLYIIHDTDKLGDELETIITRECLSR